MSKREKRQKQNQLHVQLSYCVLLLLLFPLAYFGDRLQLYAFCCCPVVYIHPHNMLGNVKRLTSKRVRGVEMGWGRREFIGMYVCVWAVILFCIGRVGLLKIFMELFVYRQLWIRFFLLLAKPYLAGNCGCFFWCVFVCVCCCCYFKRSPPLESMANLLLSITLTTINF